VNGIVNLFCARHNYILKRKSQEQYLLRSFDNTFKYEGWNFNSGNYLFTTDTK